MTHTVEMLEARIRKLNQRDPVANMNIIRKIRREIRKLEGRAD